MQRKSRDELKAEFINELQAGMKKFGMNRLCWKLTPNGETIDTSLDSVIRKKENRDFYLGQLVCRSFDGKKGKIIKIRGNLITCKNRRGIFKVISDYLSIL